MAGENGMSSTGGASSAGGASTGGQSAGGSGGVATGGTGGEGTGGASVGGAGTGGKDATGGSGTGGSPPVLDTDEDGVPDDEDLCPDGQPSTTAFGPGCVCAPGYDGSVVSETCEDIDECGDGALNDCDVNAECTNAPGTYSCNCKPAYLGDGKTCTFDSDCSQLDCADDAHCEISGTARSCECNDGFEGNGTTCSDIDECATDNGGCGDFWLCDNNIGAPPTCADIDECATDNGGCGNPTFWTCTNNEGAAPTCADVDECATDNGGCGAATFFTCTNNEGAAPTCKAKPQATERVNVSSDEEQGGLSNEPAVSGDGRFVVFATQHNFVASDTNALTDVYLRDLEAGTTELVSQSSDEVVGNNQSGSPSISHDGRFVAFASRANNLAGTDNTLTDWDVFVRDRQLGTTERISVSNDGVSSNGTSLSPQISANGRYVVFNSRATNLTADTDIYGDYDVYLRDRELGTTTLVSVSMTPNTTGDGESSFGSVSGDGRYVAFQSQVNTLVAGDTNAFGFEVFVRDMTLGVTTLISKSTAGVVGNAASRRPSISVDGSRVVFSSAADTLVAGDTNADTDIFLRDMTLGTTERVNVSYLGAQALGGDSDNPSISGDGNLVVYRSLATNLVPDTNGVRDVFVRDLTAGTTERVSVSYLGQQANGTSCNSTEAPAISHDGSVAVFSSLATNLVTGDTNGQQDIFIRRR